MPPPPENLFPEFARMLPRATREQRLGQRGVVLWFYGLSGSGKSTLALALEKRLHAQGRFTQILDGDNLRTGLNSDLGFSDKDRQENIRRIAEVAKLFAQSGIITLASFITPRESLRTLARDIIGQEDFLDIYVHCSYEQCAQRDPKGLYAKAQAGQLPAFTGKDSAFEPPTHPTLQVDTQTHDLPTCLNLLETTLLPRLRYPG